MAGSPSLIATQWESIPVKGKVGPGTEGPFPPGKRSRERKAMAAKGVESTPMPPVAQSRMENFRKVKTSEQDSPLPFPDLSPGVVEMKVKEGSKIRNLMGFAMARMELKGTRQIVFSGCGRAVTKTITCVEIMKRKLGGLHQVTKVRYKTLLEVWENKDPQPDGQVENLTVHKNVPSICILLSKDPLDPNEMGYQPPESRDGLWAEDGGTEEDRLSSLPQGVKRPLALPHGELANKKMQVQVPESQKGLGTMDYMLDCHH
ncbi:ribonuclease P protein subunit p25 isoform X1 [Mauremys mutica]|nr:ribonuclease P protein subunit p25 isoform X1 [Mauremys mutica]XP_044836377.1 ribonuclease P protein subunit p25 isoform X1 [Mauremys mutica]